MLWLGNLRGEGPMNFFTWPTFLLSRFSPRSMTTRSPFLATTLYGSGSYVADSLFCFRCNSSTLSPSAISDSAALSFAVSVDCEQSLFCSKIREEKVAEHESHASGKAARSVRGGRRAKRETAMVSCNDCEARHSGDGVILLVHDDAHLSAIFISDIRGEFESYLPTGFDNNQICQTQLAGRLSIQ